MDRGDDYLMDQIWGESNQVILFFLDYNTTGDGLLTGLQLIQVMKETKNPCPN